ncbi:Phosphate regulon sensor protein PhoR [bacterium HR40]|nr:Phosphate regulon sensor protein PhoR [bacterium HR40]
MSSLLRPRHWPLSLRVPLLVAACMIAVGTIASWLVLAVLARTQEAHLRQLARTALTSLGASLTPFVERRDVWETFDALDRFVSRREGLPATFAAVVLTDGTVLAASDPRRFPTLEPVPADWRQLWSGEADLQLADAAPAALARHRLSIDGVPIAEVFAEIDISGLLLERQQVFWALLLSNALLTLLLAAGGYVLVRRMLSPVPQLAQAVEQLRRGGKIEIPADLDRQAPEFRTLFLRFRAMAEAVEERQTLLARLIEEERLAQLGRLASAMAHEVNNPLAGLLTVVDTLKRRGEDGAVRESALELLERGLLGMRNVVRAMLVAYKEEDTGIPLTARALDDLAVLTRHEVQRRRLQLEWSNGLRAAYEIDSGALRQALLNLLLNACRAAPIGGRVVFEAEERPEGLGFVVEDNGPGLPEPFRQLLECPDSAAPPTSRGLGIWTVARLLRRLGARAEVTIGAEGGTRISIRCPARQWRSVA